MKKNLITSLKELLKALGGKETEKNNIIGVIDDITEQISESSSEQGGSNVVIVDLSELPVEYTVDAIIPLSGDIVTIDEVYLFDVDPNKYYIFKTVIEDPPGVYNNASFGQVLSETRSVAACEDTSEEPWIERKTFSDTVNITTIDAFNIAEPVRFIFVPTSTQFKTYKKYSGK